MSTVSKLFQLGDDLFDFVNRFQDCVKTRPSRAMLRTYIGGQISDLRRKSVEPMALDAGKTPRSLQEFLARYKWDHEAVRCRLQQLVAERYGADDGIAVIDETSFPKKGDDTVGVQRQYCGASGKIDNCVVSVHLGYAASGFHTLVDGDLYLPRESWCNAPAKRAKAGVPEEVQFRTKWRIALDLLKRSAAQGLTFRYLTADEGYGNVGAFRDGVDAMGLTYVLEVPRTLCGWIKEPRVLPPKPRGGNGRPQTNPHLAPGTPAPREVNRLWQRGGPAWKTFRIKDGQKGPVVWDVRAVRFLPWRKGLPGAERWLLSARNVLDGKLKYFLSNAPRDIQVEKLLHVAFSRWRIERLFQDGKTQVGMGDFEVRRYLPVTRHLIISMLSLFFLLDRTHRLREKKSELDDCPGSPGHRSAA